MSDRTSIEWTDASWNPVRSRGVAGKVGWHCEHVSEGCRNCYAEGINRRLGNGLEYKPGYREALEIFLDEKTLLAPLKWKKPRMIFVCSMTDLFADFVSDEMIDRVFAVMARAPQHAFQVLTKRAGRMRAYLNSRCSVEQQIDHWKVTNGKSPLPNVWLGVSCEDKARADERIPDLLATPAAVRFVSLEPLLGAIDLTFIAPNEGTKLNALDTGRPGTLRAKIGHLDWVIVGGESGPGARPMHPDWARKIRGDCEAACVPFFFKQWGEWQADALFGAHAEPDGMRYTRIGKRAAGRLLDGVEHNGMPA